MRQLLEYYNVDPYMLFWEINVGADSTTRRPGALEREEARWQNEQSCKEQQLTAEPATVGRSASTGSFSLMLQGNIERVRWRRSLVPKLPHGSLRRMLGLGIMLSYLTHPCESGPFVVVIGIVL